MDGRKDGWMDGCMAMDRWIDGWVVWMDKRWHGWVGTLVVVCVKSLFGGVHPLVLTHRPIMQISAFQSVP